MTASIATVQSTGYNYLLNEIMDMGSKIILGLQRRIGNSAYYNLGLVEFDKSTLSREGHFTTSTLFLINSSLHTLKHVSGELVVAAYRHNLNSELGFFFFDLATDTLDSYIQNTIYRSNIRPLDLQIDAAKNIVLLAQIGNQIYLYLKDFDSAVGREIRYSDTGTPVS